MSFDPYKVLGVTRQATDDEIKEARNKKRIYWHPDKNRAPEAATRFTEVTEAAELLLDPRKRRLYDQGGWRYVNQLEQGQPVPVKKAPPLRIVHAVSLRDIYQKETVDVSFELISPDGEKMHKSLPVPTHQIRFGATMVAEGMGQMAHDCVDGDVHIIFQEQEDQTLDLFRIDDGDLIHERELKLCDIYGFRFPLRHPSGQTLIIEHQEPIKDPEELLLIYKGYGLRTESPSRRGGSHQESRGNLVVRLKFNLCEQLNKLSDADKARLNNIPALAKSRYPIPGNAVKVKGLTPEEYRKSAPSLNPFEMLFGQMGMANPFAPRGSGSRGGRSRVVVNGVPMDNFGDVSFF